MPHKKRQSANKKMGAIKANATRKRVKGNAQYERAVKYALDNIVNGKRQ